MLTSSDHIVHYLQAYTKMGIYISSNFISQYVHFYLNEHIPQSIHQLHSSQKEMYLFKSHWFFLMTLRQGQWPWATPNFLKMLGVTQVHWPWPKVTRKNEWIKGTSLFVKSVYAFRSNLKAWANNSRIGVCIKDRMYCNSIGIHPLFM